MIKWLRENRQWVFSGIGILVISLVLDSVSQGYISRWFTGPDIVLKVDFTEENLPEDFDEWLKLYSMRSRDRENLIDVIDLALETENIKLSTEIGLEYIQEIIQDPVTIRISEMLYSGNFYIDFDNFHITLINQSNRPIENLVMRVDGVRKIWGEKIDGTFITQKDSNQIKENFEFGNSHLVLPELPVIPPNSSIEIMLYGDIDPNAKIQLESSDNSLEFRHVIKKKIEVEDNFISRLFLIDKSEAIFLLISFSGLMICVANLIKIKLDFRWKYKKLYLMARDLASSRYFDLAMILFRAAEKSAKTGSSDLPTKHRIAKDQELFSKSESHHAEFRALFELEDSISSK